MPVRRAVLRLTAAVLCGLLAALLAAPAATAAPAQGGDDRSRPVWQALHEEIEQWIDGTGARQAFLNLGVALYMFLGMVQAYSAVIGTSSSGVAETVFRVIMAGFLISLVQNGTIAEILGSAYEAFAGAGTAILSRSIGTGYGGLKQRFEDFGRRLTEAIMGHVGLIFGAFLAALIGIFVSGVGLAILAIYGAFAALYITVQLFALVILSIALLIAPLSFAAFAYRGTASWSWHWVKGILNALLTVLLANMVAGVVAWLSLRGPETVIRAVSGVGSEVGALVSGVFLPFVTLIVAPFLGIMALLRVETVVAHFSAAFGDFTGTMEQLLTSRLVLGTMRLRGRQAVVGAGGGPGGPGGVPGGPVAGGPGGGAPGGPAPGTPPSTVPPAPQVTHVPAASPVVFPITVTDRAPAPWVQREQLPGQDTGTGVGPRRQAPPPGPSGEVAGGFTGPGGAGRPPGWESLAEWSQRQFGIDLAPWQRDPSVPVPHPGMSVEQLKEIYSKAQTREGVRVAEVGMDRDGRTVVVTLEGRDPGGSVRIWDLRVRDTALPGEERKDAGRRGGLHVEVSGFTPTAAGAEFVRSRFTMRHDGSIVGLDSVKEAKGLDYSGDWRVRVPDSDRGDK